MDDEGRDLHRRQHLHTLATYQHPQQVPSPPCLQVVQETVGKQVQCCDIAVLRFPSTITQRRRTLSRLLSALSGMQPR